MLRIVVSPDSQLGELPWATLKELTECLTEEDNYLKVVRGCTNSFGDCVFSKNDVATMRTSQSPVSKFLEKLEEKAIDVRTLQSILVNSGLYDAHSVLLTNEEMKIVSPEDDMKLTALLGEDCEIPITVEGSPLPKCQWFHNDSPLHGHTQFSLNIRNFGVENVGTYWCQLTQEISKHLMVKKSGKFEVTLAHTPPVILSHPRDVIVIARKDLMLEVQAVAYPPIKCYIWYKDDCIVEETLNPWLKISEVDEKNAGRYCCVVVNEISFVKSNDAIVTVERSTMAPVTPDIRLEFSTDAKHVGEWVNLVCTATCCHPVSFHCFVSEKKIEEKDDKASIEEKSYRSKYVCYLNYRITDDDIRTKKTLKFRFVAKSSVGSQSSKDAEIKVVREQKEKTFTARNKFALLIGNWDYSHERLSTPPQDIERLAEKLKRLKFRVMMLTNLSRAEITAALRLFVKFVQKDDYVVFYFAGHGINVSGSDYMLPVDAPLKNVNEKNRTQSNINQLSTNHCICVNFVVNMLQEQEPALLFFIYDMCRTFFQPDERIKPEPYKPVTAARNACTLFSTAENYRAFEDKVSSLLIQRLIPLMEKKIPLHALVTEFQKNFGTEAKGDIKAQQFPTTVNDLAKPLSLTNEPNPRCEDFADGGVMKQWEALASVGGRKEFEMMLNGIAVTVGVQCCQEEKCNDYPEVSWIIQNCVQVVITLNASGNAFDARTVDKDGLYLVVHTSMGKQNIEKLKGIIEGPVIFTVPAIQALKDGLLVAVIFKNSKNEELGKNVQNLGWPSLAKDFQVCLCTV